MTKRLLLARISGVQRASNSLTNAISNTQPSMMVSPVTIIIQVRLSNLVGVTLTNENGTSVTIAQILHSFRIVRTTARQTPVAEYVPNKPGKAEALIQCMLSNDIRNARRLANRVIITFTDGGTLEMSIEHFQNMKDNKREQRHTA